MTGSLNSDQLEKDDSTENIKRSHQRVPFTTEEDNKLRKLVHQYGSNNWALVSKHIPKRNARQCRDRWLNYLSPDVVNGPWTEEEDQLLMTKYKEIGPCWKQIATFFPTRTDINIKSRWNLRKRHIKKEKLIIAKELLNQRILGFSSKPSSESNDLQTSKESETKNESSEQEKEHKVEFANQPKPNPDNGNKSTQNDDGSQQKTDSTNQKPNEKIFSEELLSSLKSTLESNQGSEEFFDIDENDSFW